MFPQSSRGHCRQMVCLALRHHAETYRNYSMRTPPPPLSLGRERDAENGPGRGRGSWRQTLRRSIEAEQVVEVNHVPNVRLHAHMDYMLEERMRSPCAPM